MTTKPAGASPVDRGVSRLYADAMDADRLARGEAPKAEVTERRVFDDDIEVERCDCEHAAAGPAAALPDSRMSAYFVQAAKGL